MNATKNIHDKKIDNADYSVLLPQVNRRDFTKKLLSAGVLSSLTLFSAPDAALAWLDGNIRDREDLGDALKVILQTYTDTDPYPHKFNDALVKLLLRDLDFVVTKGLDKEFADHYVYTLGALVNKYLKAGVEMLGKDLALWGMFERTSCSYQLYEKINIEENQRSFPCPYKAILGHTQKSLGTYTINWDDVHTKWCIPVWNGFATGAGVKIKVEPGETCMVKVL